MLKTITLTIAAYNLGELAQDPVGLEAYRAGVQRALEERWPGAEVTVEVAPPGEAFEDEVDARGFQDGDEIAEVEVAALAIAQDVWSDPAAWVHPAPDEPIGGPAATDSAITVQPRRRSPSRETWAGCRGLSILEAPRISP